MTALTAEMVKTSLIALGVTEGVRLAVAVSGGADSVALLLLAHRLIRLNRHQQQNSLSEFTHPIYCEKNSV